MTLVTLTDHDTIAGGLELIDQRPDFFLSEEVTARFPAAEGDGEGCAVHILVWNLTPGQHERIQALRPDIYALVDYLRTEGLAHGLAHPLESPNRKLDVATLEKLFLLFSTFETVNGRAAEELNGGLRTLLGGLDARALRKLSLAHSLPAARGVARPQSVVGGSDDHEHPGAAKCFTEVDGEGGVRELLAGVMAGKARAVGRGADVIELGMAFGATAYQFLDELAADGADPESPFSYIMDTLASRDRVRTNRGGGAEFLEQVRRVARDVAAPGAALDVRDLARGVVGADVAAAQIAVCDGIVGGALSAATDAAIDADFFGLFAAFRDAAGGVKGMLPFLFAAHHLGRHLYSGAGADRGYRRRRRLALPRILHRKHQQRPYAPRLQPGVRAFFRLVRP